MAKDDSLLLDRLDAGSFVMTARQAKQLAKAFDELTDALTCCLEKVMNGLPYLDEEGNALRPSQ